MGRAVVLLLVAILIGLALLGRSPSRPVSVGGTTTTNVAGFTPETTLRSSTNSSRPGSAGNPTTTQPLRAKADIKVLVANGTGTSGLASTVSNTLRSKGYNTLASTNASLKVTSSFVYYQPGYDADAAAMATGLGLATSAAKPMPVTLPVPSVNGVNILVVVGPDLGSAGTTSTTGRGATTTTVR